MGHWRSNMMLGCSNQSTGCPHPPTHLQIIYDTQHKSMIMKDSPAAQDALSNSVINAHTQAAGAPGNDVSP
jgi:hypothetical protein